MVARCADVHRSPESVLSTLARDARVLRAWRPGTRSLCEAVAIAAVRMRREPPIDPCGKPCFYAAAMAAVPVELRPVPDDDGLDGRVRVIRAPAVAAVHAPLDRYIAAKAFASWTAYQGRGIATIVRGLEAAARAGPRRGRAPVPRSRSCARRRSAARGVSLRRLHPESPCGGRGLAEGWSAVEV